MVAQRVVGRRSVPLNSAAVVQSAPWEALAVCAVLLFAPSLASQRSMPTWQLLGLMVALAVALFASSGVIAYAAVAVGAMIHAVDAWPRTRTGGLFLGASALVCVAASAAMTGERLTAAFLLSSLAVAIRAGVLPFHVGVAALCERAPVVQTQQLASTIALVFVHLRFVDHHAAAVELAPLLVRYGAIACFVAALMTLVQRDLRGLYRGTTAMHGGMLLAGMGAASLGNFAAALLVAVAMGLALGGLGVVITSLESRVGPVSFAGPGGLARTFPRLAAAFALFGGAGVGLPGTAGFVADDLLLHTLWMESPASTVTVILSSAMLAVATLLSFARVFLGRTTSSLAPDLHARERLVMVMLLLGLLTLGFAPWALLGPADAFLSGPPA
jgi:NADH:ubiquinone oxidoreductase subunit 4 (subunit M)